MISIEDYIAKVVAKAPPLGGEQRDRLVAILGGDATPRPGPYIAPEPAPEEIQRAEDAARLARVQRALSVCGICDIPEAGHVFNKQWHEFVPLTADQIRTIMQDNLP